MKKFNFKSKDLVYHNGEYSSRYPEGYYYLDISTTIDSNWFLKSINNHMYCQGNGIPESYLQPAIEIYSPNKGRRFCRPLITKSNRPLFVFEGAWSYYINDLKYILTSVNDDKFYLDITKKSYVLKQDVKTFLSRSNQCFKCGELMEESTLFANYHNIDSKKPEFETKHEKCMKCIKCGHSYTLGVKTDLPSKKEYIKFDEELNGKANKEKALDWWNSLNSSTRWKYFKEINKPYLKYPSNLRSYEITMIWQNQKSKIEKVDFELANQTFETVINYFKEKVPVMISNIDNLELFWNKLSKSSSFAHLAHKELKKINS